MQRAAPHFVLCYCHHSMTPGLVLGAEPVMVRCVRRGCGGVAMAQAKRLDTGAILEKLSDPSPDGGNPGIGGTVWQSCPACRSRWAKGGTEHHRDRCGRTA